MGRYSTLWIRLQDQFLSSQGISSPSFSGTRLLTSTITSIWQHLHRLWLRRNDDTHGSTTETIEAAAYSQAQREVVELYALKSRVHSEDLILFYESPTVHFQLSPTSTSLRNWLNTWRPVILRSANAFP